MIEKFGSCTSVKYALPEKVAHYFFSLWLHHVEVTRSY